MANSNWNNGKAKGRNQAKAWLRHDDASERVEVNHSNPDIRLELYDWNYQLGVTANLSYQEKCIRLDERLDKYGYKEKDGKNNPVSLFSVCIYPPDGLLEYDEEMDAFKDTDALHQWFQNASDIWEEFCGEENVMSFGVHFDEQHWYIPKGSKEKVLSKPHAHAKLVPVVDERLSCKAFYTKDAPKRLNNALDKMTEDVFGMDYLSHEKRDPHRQNQTVEDLKRESERIEQLEQSLLEVERELDLSEQELKKQVKETKKLENENEKLKGRNRGLQEKFNQAQEIHKREINKLIDQKNDAEARLATVIEEEEGHKKRRDFYQQQAKDRRHESAEAGKELTSIQGKLDRRIEKYKQYGDKLRLNEQVLHHSDEMIEDKRRMDAALKDFSSSFGNKPEDMELALEWSKMICDRYNGVASRWNYLMDDLKEMEFSPSVKEKIRNLDFHVDEGEEVAYSAKSIAMRLLNAFHNSYTFKRWLEEYVENEEEYIEAKEAEARIEVDNIEIRDADKGNELEM